MGPVERSATFAAKPETIWKACFAHMKWELWDVDVEKVEDIEGDGCTTGTTFVFVMADSGMRAKTKLSDVVENERLTFSGGMFGGAASFRGDIVLTPESDGKTLVNYTFEMKGCLGGLLNVVQKSAVVGGTEKGLANIGKLSEEAEKK
jgi:uncharacterized protein YndB with AHSA1/START domain